MHPILDTHQHLWDLSRFDLPWVEGAGILNRSFLPEDYATAVEGLAVDGTVYMEVDVSPDQSAAEADYVSQLCADESQLMRAAVVGGRPGQAGFSDVVVRCADNPHIRGIRQVLHIPDTPRGTCLEGAYIEDIRALGKADLSFDVCLRPTEICDAVALAEACPDTLLILDHCGNADPHIVATNGDDLDEENPFSHTAAQWLADMDALGRKSNVVCKVSGIVARVQTGWTAETLAPTVNHCLDSFGPDRVVFGGDWPVCTLGASYAEWASALRQIISARPDEEQRKLLADNAARIYKV
ncbi:MAG: amidohydrolase family protein [Gemmatimonadetes bacterium]|jgi:L-fuconolactonase|nr:amidohydrolase family protein [Gemmatimonadota bacterium]MBT6149142.1 amidohydrolase family protein [Gemmatimonadota bacterium]MBT7864076.1 amidohydrolase family protein [Gemmatimonadota bacterium]